MRGKCVGFMIALTVAAAGCTQHVMVPQLVRSYRTDWPQAVGPDGKPLVPSVTVLVANEPYLRDQCANQVQAGGGPLHSGAQVDRFGCVRISAGDRPEIVVPDTNEQAAVAHQLDHLKGLWCHDPQGNATACTR